LGSSILSRLLLYWCPLSQFRIPSSPGDPPAAMRGKVSWFSEREFFSRVFFVPLMLFRVHPLIVEKVSVTRGEGPQGILFPRHSRPRLPMDMLQMRSHIPPSKTYEVRPATFSKLLVGLNSFDKASRSVLPPPFRPLSRRATCQSNGCRFSSSLIRSRALAVFFLPEPLVPLPSRYP